ncbi:MAG: PaaI family thioesterase [Syntrophales bacterium]|jgi:uncharacterized protein (TIGR00369 family)
MAGYASYLEQLRVGDRSGNPFLEFMGMNLLKLDEGYASFSMEIRPAYLQGAGLMQGGLIVAMADETIAHAVMTVLKEDEGITTVELKNDFLAGVKDGLLVAEARIFKKGRRLIIGDCIVKTREGWSVARTSATLLILNETK